MVKPQSLAPLVRNATTGDIESIQQIYNEGIADHATLDVEPKSADDMAAWWSAHGDRYAVIVAEIDGQVVGWASLTIHTGARIVSSPTSRSTSRASGVEPASGPRCSRRWSEPRRRTTFIRSCSSRSQ